MLDRFHSNSILFINVNSVFLGLANLRDEMYLKNIFGFAHAHIRRIWLLVGIK